MMAGKKKTGKRRSGNPRIERSLRDSAEEKLTRSLKSGSSLKEQTTEELVHELEVHQIELEMQAEELRRAHLALEESRDKYLNLYEFAPLGYLTLTDKAMIAEANLTSALLLGIDRNKLVKSRFNKFIADKDVDDWHRYFMSVLNQGGKQTCTLGLMRGDGTMFPARLEGIRIIEGNGGTPAVWVAFSEIRDIKRVEDALCMSNKKLNILSSITRHDISNQLMTLAGNLTLLKKQKPALKSNDHLLRAEAATERVYAMIQFTKEYQDIGVQAPIWQDAQALVETEAKGLALGSIKLKNDIPAGLEVYADPLIAKVFHNLISNAERHGGKITEIRFYIEEHGDVRAFVCEDDGVGIHADMKEELFTRISKKEHGFGLFLSREILAITGISIREDGEPGKGARFEITMPNGTWRRRETPTAG